MPRGLQRLGARLERRWGVGRGRKLGRNGGRWGKVQSQLTGGKEGRGGTESKATSRLSTWVRSLIEGSELGRAETRLRRPRPSSRAPHKGALTVFLCTYRHFYLKGKDVDFYRSQNQ